MPVSAGVLPISAGWRSGNRACGRVACRARPCRRWRSGDRAGGGSVQIAVGKLLAERELDTRSPPTWTGSIWHGRETALARPAPAAWRYRRPALAETEVRVRPTLRGPTGASPAIWSTKSSGDIDDRRRVEAQQADHIDAQCRAGPRTWREAAAAVAEVRRERRIRAAAARNSAPRTSSPSPRPRASTWPTSA